MKTPRLERMFATGFTLAVLAVAAFGQQTTVTSSSPRAMAVEVTYFKGLDLAYQRVGEWSWYARFKRPANWKLREGELPVSAVKITSRFEADAVKARVTVLRGKNHETEDFVAEYTLSGDKKITVRELADVGVEPFEIQLVPAPLTVAGAPAVVNMTKSLQVTTEPSQSTLPNFSVNVLNTSSKPVAAIFMFTSIDQVKKTSGLTQNADNSALILPGQTFQRTLRYPIKSSPVSTGEVPPPLSNLQINVLSVIFTDGSHEGDDVSAATYLAVKLGEKTQLKRFVEMIRSKDFTNSEGDLSVAISSVNVDTLAAEIAQKFTSLSEAEKVEVHKSVDFGKNVAVKFYRSLHAEPASTVVERLQKRIDSMP